MKGVPSLSSRGLNLTFLINHKKRIYVLDSMSFNPYANDELSRLENLTFLWTWILRWVPKSFATHPSLCNTLSSNTLCPKTVKMLALKGLKVIFHFLSLSMVAGGRGTKHFI